MSALVHYTCGHNFEEILTSGLVRPAPQPVLGHRALSWWTDITWPTPMGGLGLTSYLLSCDRTQYMVKAADVSSIIPWVEWASDLPRLQRGLLETPGTLPMHWFVSEVDVPIEVAS